MVATIMNKLNTRSFSVNIVLIKFPLLSGMAVQTVPGCVIHLFIHTVARKGHGLTDINNCDAFPNM